MKMNAKRGRVEEEEEEWGAGGSEGVEKA